LKRRVVIVLLFLTAFSLMGSLLTPPVPSADADQALLTGARIAPGVLAILSRSCVNCHSEATRYPWYSYVAPVSWLIESDVARGRRHLDLSHWSEYPRLRQMRSLSEIANQVKDGDMPLWYYTLIHRDAKLSAADVNAVFEWTQTERARLIGQ
jgi:hypothetical protein